MATVTLNSAPDKLMRRHSFTDTESCHCALRLIAEEGVADRDNTKAWRCIGDITQDIYSGLTGKWFFPIKRYSSPSSEERPNREDWLPDTDLWYSMRLVEDGKSVEARSVDSLEISSLDEPCSGKIPDQESMEEPQHSSLLVQRTDGATLSKRTRNISHSCLGGPEVLSLTIQNATSWNETGCLPGFLCKCCPIV